jgi:hypothetical protein
MSGGGDLGALLNAYGSDDETSEPQQCDENEAGVPHMHGFDLPQDLERSSLPPSPTAERQTLGIGGAPDTTQAAQTTHDDVEKPLKTLPPEFRRTPEGECDPELEARVAKWIQIQRQGPRLIDQLRGSREYRNPEFFRKMIERWEIDEHGSCFDPQVFDPKSLPDADTLTALESEWAREKDRRKKMRVADGGGQIEFVKAQATAAHIAAAQAKAAALAASYKRR